MNRTQMSFITATCLSIVCLMGQLVSPFDVVGQDDPDSLAEASRDYSKVRKRIGLRRHY